MNQLRDKLITFLEQKEKKDTITNKTIADLLTEKQVTIATENKSLLDSHLKNHNKMETKIIRKLDQVIQFPQVTVIDQIRHKF